MTKTSNLSIDKQADLLQSMSIEHIKQLFDKGTTITFNRDVTIEVDDTDLATKMQQTGLPLETIKTIETDKTQAVLQDIIQYCKALNLPLIDFLQEELVLSVAI